MSKRTIPPLRLSAPGCQPDQGGPAYTRYLIERNMVLLRPKPPYLRWVHQKMHRTRAQLRQFHKLARFAEKPLNLITLADMNDNATVYLINQHEGPQAEQQALQHVHDDFLFFFRRELEQWEEDESHWPAPLTLDLFKQWFDVRRLNTVLDVGAHRSE